MSPGGYVVDDFSSNEAWGKGQGRVLSPVGGDDDSGIPVDLSGGEIVATVNVPKLFPAVLSVKAPCLRPEGDGGHRLHSGYA